MKKKIRAKRPYLSVVVPAYNEERNIKRGNGIVEEVSFGGTTVQRRKLI